MWSGLSRTCTRLIMLFEKEYNYTPMKTKAIFYFMLLLVLGAIFSCSSSDDEGIDYALVLDDYNYEPLFTHKDFEAVSRKYEETTNGTWAIRKVNGIVCQITFFTEGTDPAPTPASPKTPEDFFSEFLPITADNQLKLEGKDYLDNPHYKQYYKGIPVEQGQWYFSYLNGLMQAAFGTFVPIGELNVNPAINSATARKIMENYIQDSIEGDGKCFYLSVMSFPDKPRLVYVYKYQVWEEGEFIYLDAQTGRLLYHIGYIGGAPY